MSKIRERKGILDIDYGKAVRKAIIASFNQLNPFLAIKNPIIFFVYISFILMLLLTYKPDIFGATSLTKEINFIISLLLFLTILFSNFAENITKQLAIAQAESLRIIHGDIEVKKVLANGMTEYVFASQLKKDNIIKVQEGDLIPLDGEVIEGIATVDESSITGESSPVLKEPNTDINSSVTGGTRILTDSLLIKITSQHGETYLDQMVNIASNAEKHKTPNEITLNVFLIANIISILLAITTLPTIMSILDIKFEPSYLIALFVCLIPTTIGGLITPIRISGFNKVNKLNILSMSESTIESSGDIDLLFIDKTGTITHGNRMATEFIPIGNNSIIDVAKYALIASYFDQTPEGKSILLLARRYGIDIDAKDIQGIPHEFTAHTRMSGIDLENGTLIRKGASDTIKKFILNKKGGFDSTIEQLVRNIALQGGTPLLISKDNEIIGLIHLKDIIKPGLKDRFKELEALEIESIMCTGDNGLTAKIISKEAGIARYIAESKPEEKIHLIRKEQSNGLVIGMIGDGTNDAPALAQADIGLAMNNGTVAAKEAANMIDLDSDPSKIVDVIKTGKELLITRGALTTFSIMNDISKYFVILPSIFNATYLRPLNIMNLNSELSAVISALIFNTFIIPAMAPIALRGIKTQNIGHENMLRRNLLQFGLGGLLLPFISIKLIDLIIGRFIQ